MKAVYVLTSDSGDFYLEQLAISLYSLRIHNPELEVEIVTDRETADSLDQQRRKLLSGVTRIVSIDVSKGFNKMQRSRWLKTSLRNLIIGDYVFIDTDTIICRELPVNEEFDGDIFAVKDLHINIDQHAHRYDIEARANLIGWDISNPSQPYHNSGVMIVKDTDVTHKFYQRWNEEWQASAAKGCSSDQPSLCKINIEEGNLIRPLDDRWNCQVTENGLRFLDEAYIIHYFASGERENRKPYLFDDVEIYRKVRKDGVSRDIEKMLKNPRTAFRERVQLISDKDIDFFNSPLCRHLRRFYYEHNKLYNRIVNLGRKFKRI